MSSRSSSSSSSQAAVQFVLVVVSKSIYKIHDTRAHSDTHTHTHTHSHLVVVFLAVKVGERRGGAAAKLFFYSNMRTSLEYVAVGHVE